MPQYIRDMAGKDYYGILGIPEDAGAQAIREAFRKLALQYHPDRNPGDEQAEAYFKEINEAHEVLSDPQQRARYDQLTGRGLYRKPDGFGPAAQAGETSYASSSSPRHNPWRRQQRPAVSYVGPVGVLEIFAVFSVMLCFFGSFFLIPAWIDFWRLSSTTDWPAVSGQITSVETVQRGGRLTYTYSVDGQQYTGHTDYGGSQEYGESLIGMAVAVYYDPSQPANSALESGISPILVCCLGTGILLVLPGILLVGIVVLRRLLMLQGNWDWLLFFHLGEREAWLDGTIICHIFERGAVLVRSLFLAGSIVVISAVLLGQAGQLIKLLLTIIIFITTLGAVALWYFQDTVGFDVIILPDGGIKIRKAS